jgi:hypothetical protein
MTKFRHCPATLKLISKTASKCHTLIQEAINSLPVTIRGQFEPCLLRRLQFSPVWSIYSRTHSPLLMQVTFTNALESYHCQVKSKSSADNLPLDMVARRLIGVNKYHDTECDKRIFCKQVEVPKEVHMRIFHIELVFNLRIMWV